MADPVISEYYMSARNSAEGMRKLAEVTESVIRKCISQRGLARRILTVETITPNGNNINIVPSTTGGEAIVTARLFVEPDAYALRSSALGTPDVRVLRSTVTEVGLFNLTTPRVILDDYSAELQQKGFSDILEEKSVIELEAMEDRIFFKHVRAGVTAATIARAALLSQVLDSTVDIATYLFTSLASATGVWGAIAPASINRVGPHGSNILAFEQDKIDKDVLTDLKQITIINEARPQLLVMKEATWNDIGRLDADQVGDSIAVEFFDKGVTERKGLLGVPVLSSIRDDERIVAEGELFVFPGSEFLGKMFQQGEVQLYMDRTSAHITEWDLSERIGIGVKNCLQVGLGILKGFSTHLYLPSSASSGLPLWKFYNDHTASALQAATVDTW